VIKQRSPYSKARNIFLVLFSLSTVLFFILAFLLVTSSRLLAPVAVGTPGRTSTPQVGGTSRPSITPTPAPLPIGRSTDALTIGGLVAALTSCMTSVVTFVGFASTTVLAWRKEAREAKAADMERRKLEIQLEKERVELEKLKAEQEERRKSK
jgi:hypothetical protein